jgi:hypothetical protein
MSEVHHCKAPQGMCAHAAHHGERHIPIVYHPLPNPEESRESVDDWCPYKGMPHPPHNISQGWACPGGDW